ncbi:MAG: hypothetical protein ACRD3O_04320 [Terriglobia bacterium]
MKNVRQERRGAGAREIRRKVHQQGKLVPCDETAKAPSEEGVPILSVPLDRTDRDGLKDRGQP